MNILFLSDYEISPNAGGVERVMFTLSGMFENRGIKCFSAYCKNKGVGRSASFHKSICLDFDDINQFREFMVDNAIDIVITALMNKHNIIFLMPKVYAITRKLDIKVIFTYHTMPGFELRQKISIKLALYKIKHGTSLKETFSMLIISLIDKLGLVKVLHPIVRHKLSFSRYSDLIILLSDRYIDTFKSFVGVLEIPIIAIPNPLTYSEDADCNIASKEHVVLSVGRFDLVAKRQDLLLDIWSEVEKFSQDNSWTLILVGYGDEEEYLRKYADNLKLKRVVFAGFCDPYEYYQQASIFAMTSSYEGFGIVLVEAKQLGVVPMAFDSFASVHDIIDNEVDGYVIAENHLSEYAEKLLFLMNNDDVRRCMSKKGFESCKQFKKENIANRWIAILDALHKGKIIK